MLATHETRTPPLHQFQDIGFTEVDVLQSIQSPKNKAYVIKSSRHLNKDRDSPFDLQEIDDDRLVDDNGNAVEGKQESDTFVSTNNIRTMIRPSWPVDERRLPGTNLNRRQGSAKTIANENAKRLVRRDSVVPKRTSIISKDKAFMKVGNRREIVHSGDSDDELAALLSQSSNTRKLRRRLSSLTQDGGANESGQPVGNSRRKQSRRLSKIQGEIGRRGSILINKKQEAEEDNETERVFRADLRTKFRAAGFMAIFSARLALAYVRTTTESDISPFAKQVKFKGDESKTTDFLDDSPLGFDPTKFKANRDMRISEETKRILSKPAWSRTTREVYHVEVLLRDIKAYADYPVGMQRKIAEVGQYRKYDAKRVIVREGHVASNFYFILSGSVVVLVMDEGRKYAKPVAYLHRGDSFGELSIIHNKNRQSTVVAKETVEMLAIWVDDYLDIFMAGGVQNMYDPDHNSFIANVSILRHWPLKLLKENESKFVFHFYKRGEIVVKDSNFSNWIVIVKSGSLSVLKKLKKVDAFEWKKKKSPDTSVKHKSKRAKKKEATSRQIMRRIVLPELNIPLKTPDDSDKLFDDDHLTNIKEKCQSMQSLQSTTDTVETSDSQRTLIKPHGVSTDTEESDDEQIDMEDFQQEVRTLADDYDNVYRKKDPDEYTAADKDPQFVRVQLLTKGMHFGVAEFVFDTQPSLCVVSGGAECILFDKQFYLEHAPDKCLSVIRKEVSPFPSDEEMQSGLQTCVDWVAYKEVALANALGEIRSRKAQFKEEQRPQIKL